MVILGLQKTTLLDYPEHVAATIFLGGCNFRCPFCHNMDIVEIKNKTENYTEEDILSFLNKRSGVLDGVCITGGEPTIYNTLPTFIKNIKEIKRKNSDRPYLIKLDTNGTNPEMLKILIKNRLIDYVAMDIKSSINNYGIVAGISENKECIENVIIAKVKESVRVLIESGIDYEFRTTIIKNYHNENVIKDIGKLISGAKKYYLQSFTDSEYVPNHTLEACDKDVLNRYTEILREYVDLVEIRGVD